MKTGLSIGENIPPSYYLNKYFEKFVNRRIIVTVVVWVGGIYPPQLNQLHQWWYNSPQGQWANFIGSMLMNFYKEAILLKYMQNKLVSLILRKNESSFARI